MIKKIKWGAVIGVAAAIIAALIVIHYALRITALTGLAH
jgi:hypothetical protein